MFYVNFSSYLKKYVWDENCLKNNCLKRKKNQLYNILKEKKYEKTWKNICNY